MFNSLNCKIKNFVPEAVTQAAAILIIRDSGQFPSWQWTGINEFGVILEWCEEQFADDYIWNWETIYFKHEKDLTAFLLKWN